MTQLEFMTGELRRNFEGLNKKDYAALKKCMTEGAGLLLSDRMDEKTQILGSLEDALSFLYKDCMEARGNFIKTVYTKKAGDWETTLACLILQENYERIRDTADELIVQPWWHCQKCGHRWRARGATKPARCAKCKSPTWEELGKPKASPLPRD